MPCAFNPVTPGMPEIPADTQVGFSEDVGVLVVFRPAGEPEEMKIMAGTRDDNIFHQIVLLICTSGATV
jgi:hypothetical protein